VGLLILGSAMTVFYEWYSYGRHVKAVVILLEMYKDECKGEERFPLWVLIGNSSGKVLEKTEFSLEARRKGRSSNVAQFYLYKDDHIIDPGKVGEAVTPCRK
jgi:hypothetical protein